MDEATQAVAELHAIASEASGVLLQALASLAAGLVAARSSDSEIREKAFRRCRDPFKQSGAPSEPDGVELARVMGRPGVATRGVKKRAAPSTT